MKVFAKACDEFAQRLERERSVVEQAISRLNKICDALRLSADSVDQKAALYVSYGVDAAVDDADDLERIAGMASQFLAYPTEALIKALRSAGVAYELEMGSPWATCPACGEEADDIWIHGNEGVFSLYRCHQCEACFARHENEARMLATLVADAIVGDDDDNRQKESDA